MFEDNGEYRAISPSDPALENYPNHICLDVTLEPSEEAEIDIAIANFVQRVRTATGGILDPSVTTQVVDGIETGLTRWGNGFFMAPWDASGLLSTSRQVDGILLTHGMLDHSQQVVLPIPACGGTLGADSGIGAAGFSWIPFSNGYPFQCAAGQTYFHEWLHQVDWAVEHLMLVPDIYHDVYPACGLGDPGTLQWFPSADTCTTDPDWSGCGQTYCPDLDGWNAHILEAHYDLARPYIGNHCRDDRQDYGETGIDTGGVCSGP
jgi:hypothetical protein